MIVQFRLEREDRMNKLEQHKLLRLVRLSDDTLFQALSIRDLDPEIMKEISRIERELVALIDKIHETE